MDDLSTGIVVVFLGDPVSGEGGEGAESGGTGPNRVVSVRRGNDLGHTSLGGLLLDLVIESGIDTLIKSGTTGKDDVGVKVGSNIDITVVDRLDGELGKTESLITLLGESRLEDELGGLESRSVDLDNLTIGKLEVLLMLVGGTSLTKSLLVVLSDEASLLLDASNNLLPSTSSTLGSDTVEGQKFFHVLGNGSTSNEVLSDGVRDGETFEDGDSVGNTITGVANNTGGSTIGIQRHDGLDGNIETIDGELLEHDLGHLLSVSLGVAGSLSKEDIVLGRIASELVVEGILPDLVHVVPVGDDTRLNGVGKLEDTSHLLSLITNVLGFLLNTDHSVTSWGTNERGELDGRLSLFREAGLEYTGTIINNNVFVSHVVYVDGVF